MLKRFSASVVLGAILGLGMLFGCQSTPDYRIIAHHIPASTSEILIGFQSESGGVSKSSLAVPVAGLSAEERQIYSIGVALADLEDGAGILSLATVSQAGCLTSVVSSDKTSHSNDVSVVSIDIEFDPAANPRVVTLSPAYQGSGVCPKLPGLSIPLSDEPQIIPTRPVIINTFRYLRGPVGVINGAILIYGWGFDRGAVSAVVAKDPSGCIAQLKAAVMPINPNYALLFTLPWTFPYPNYDLPSYSEADLQLEQVKEQLSQLPPVLLTTFLQCLGISALTYTIKNSDGNSTSFTEVLP